MRTKFDIKIKWNQIIRDKIEEKSNIQKDKKQNKKNSNQNNKSQIVYIKQIKGNSCILPRIRARNGKEKKNIHWSYTTSLLLTQPRR
jgi:hypothetical protein